MFVTGGRINDAPTNQAEMVDVDNHSGTHTKLPVMQVPRRDHALTAGGSFVFAFGGYDERNERTSETFLNQAELLFFS